MRERRLIICLFLLSGAMISCGPQRSVVERVAVYPSDEQRKIDEVSREISDSTKWGRGESKPWKKRYIGENPNRPYQRPANPRELKTEEEPKFELDD